MRLESDAAPRRPADSRAPWLIPAAALLVATLSVLADLGLQHVVNINEAQRLEPPAEMLAAGDWVIPTIDGEPYLSKPPLMYWLIGGAYLLAGGESALAGRIPVALVCLGVAAALVAIGRQLGNARLGLWSATVLLSAFFFRDRAQEAEIDPVLMGAMMGVVYFQWRAAAAEPWRVYAVVAGVFAGAALLVKGPVFFPFLLASTIAIWWVERPRARRLAASLAVITGLGAAIFLPWGIEVVRRIGWRAAWATVSYESIERVATAPEINTGPIYFYLPALAAGFLPWTWLLAVWVVRRFRRADPAATSAVVRLAAAFSLVSVVVWSLIAAKELKYLLPIFPWLALASGAALEWVLSADDPVARRFALWGLGASAAVGALGPIVFATELATWLRPASAGGALVLVGAAVSVGALWLLARSRDRELAAALVTVGLVMGITGVTGGVKRRTNEIKSAVPMARAAARLRAEGVDVYRFQPGRSAVFYLRPVTAKMPGPEPGSVLPPEPVEYTVIAKKDSLDALVARLGRRTEVLSADGLGTRSYVLARLRSTAHYAKDIR